MSEEVTDDRRQEHPGKVRLPGTEPRDAEEINGTKLDLIRKRQGSQVSRIRRETSSTSTLSHGET